MDEPTAALAVREVEHVLDLIRTLKRDGISVILISHRLTDVFSVCDRIVVLRQGAVIADDSTREIAVVAFRCSAVAAAKVPQSAPSIAAFSGWARNRHSNSTDWAKCASAVATSRLRKTRVNNPRAVKGADVPSG